MKRFVCLSLLCLLSASAYVAGRGIRLKANGVSCIFGLEGYVLWNGTRSVVHGLDPYSDEATQQNEVFAYSSLANSSGGFEPQRFAYPMHAILPLFPLGWLNFSFAKWILLILFTALAAAWVYWLRGAWDERSVIYTILILGSYPVLYDIVSLQPAILALALAIASLALLRANHPLLAAAVAAVSVVKPQISGPLLLPALVSALTNSTIYRKFTAWFLVFGFALISIGLILQHNWITEWLLALRDYAQYSPHSMVSNWFGPAAPVISVIMFMAILALQWAYRKADLLFRASTAVILLYPLLPYRTYNAIVFLVPLVWLADNASSMETAGALTAVTSTIVRLGVCALWLLTAAGAVLLWSPAWKIGLMLPVLGLQILFFSLFALMLSLMFPLSVDALMPDSLES